MPGREVVEALGAGLTRHWRLDAVRAELRTPFQHVLIAETAHGTTLFCDDERQSAESTQLVYHEALFLPPALLAARCERVLVIGSSEGVVSQLAVAAGAEVVDHVDIDPHCVRACAEHLPYGYSPEELAAAERHDGPVRVHYGDGLAFVAETTSHYDVVVVDLPDERPDDPDAQLNRLYDTAFLRRCAELLTDGGVVTSQAGSPALWRDATLRAARDRFREVFAQVVPYVSDEHEWAFLTGRRAPGPDPVGEMTKRLSGLGFRPATLDAEALQARSLLPFGLRRGPIGATGTLGR
jgi:spermidine synthase